ncbi:hypothetical protein BD410DRAFT_816690 [Rickenella mellea]|uniref:Tc1-like transposase DDE domain-containing protein n=1 Tax=Rickenella mellea TaxID=50990 RepID=A0A4Y7PMA3_9AGAM|nr:hypothetical protein BD410DRAFT_816690 [Rickenella mellea]
MDFKAGKNRDGYFGNDDLMQQVDKAIDIFEERFHSFATALFAFDNATSHQKGKCRMRPGTLPNGEQQDLYFPNDHPQYPGFFKGMQIILRERGLQRESELRAECPGFKCVDESKSAACCCRRVLFNQPDFKSQKPALFELIEGRGHKAIFYPKFHCELNFIEQCWGAAKHEYRQLPPTINEAHMEANVRDCLNGIPLDSMRRYANRSARFMDAYRRGLNGAQAAWVNRRYHGHRVLSEAIMKQFEQNDAFKSL